jgi:GABA(A) receptor-associated protein
MSIYKQKYTLDQRREQSLRILSKYVYHIPVIVEKHRKSDDLPDIDKHKLLVPLDLNVSQFIYFIRKKIVLSPEKALFVFVEDSIILLSNSEPMLSIYEKHKSSCGFLYITYSCENTFG